MSEMIRIANLDGVENKELYEELVILAYESPRYNSKKMQNLTIVDFQNEIYLNCIKEYRAKE